MKQKTNKFALASRGTRLLNYLIDHICIVIVYFIVCFVLGFFLGIILGPTMGTDHLITIIESSEAAKYYPILFYLVYILYYLVFENISGKTIGKYITRTRTVSETGDSPTFLQVLGRTLSRFIPFEPFSFITSESGWHDRASRTIVVKIEKTNRYNKLEELSELHKKKLITDDEFTSEKKKFLDSL